MARSDRKKGWDAEERRGPTKVLIAGDAPDPNELVTRILAAHGYEPSVADSIETGLTHVVEHQPRVAVVDLSSRGVGSSLRLLDLIRSHDDPVVRRTRVIVVARSAANRSFTFESGADGFLLRPYHATELLELIEDVLAVAEDDLPAHRSEMIRRPS